MAQSNQVNLITLTPQQAYDQLMNDPQSILVDIRSSMEFLMIGHPVGAKHIPWMDEPEWTPQPEHFLTQIRELLLGGNSCEENQCRALILICRSGHRSNDAGLYLLENGIKRVAHIDSGFEGPLDSNHHRSTISGWRHDNLPWEQC